MNREQKYYKIVRYDYTHNDMVYKLGLNKDILDFNPSGSCESGGLYFTDYENLGTFCNYGSIVATIRLCNDSQVYKDPDGNKWKADKFVIESFEPIKPTKLVIYT